MIIKKEEQKTNDTIKKFNFKKKIKENKNKILIIFLLLIIIVGSFFIIKIFTKKTYIYIDVFSSEISYTYGPGASTDLNLKIGQKAEITIDSDSLLPVKCYASNKDIINVINNKEVVAKSKGSSQIYCETNGYKSNMISVIVGD